MNLESVMATNEDAASCKRSAVALGYWSDPFLPLIIGNRSCPRRTPEINRGYLVRVWGMQRLVELVLSRYPGGRVQVVSLGAGSDSLYWRLKSAGASFKSFVELDLGPVVAKKAILIRQRPELLSMLSREDGEICVGSEGVHSADYHLAVFDLNHAEKWPDVMRSCHLSPDSPTLFLAECVLVYVPADSVARLLRSLSASFSSALFVHYEMLNMNDRFGDVLVSNLRARDCDLHGIDACISREAQIARMTGCGWCGACVWDMNQVMACLPPAELHRTRQLELLDEEQLLLQLLSHYGITLAWTQSLRQLAHDISFS